MKRSIRSLTIVFLPLALLCTGIVAERALSSEHDSDHTPIITLGDHPEMNPEKAVLRAFVQHLSDDPHGPVAIVWRESVGGVGMVERRATYFPEEKRLVDLTMGETMIHKGVTFAGMRRALENGSRTATFACAEVSSSQPVPQQSPVAAAPGSVRHKTPPGPTTMFNAKLTGT